MAETSCSKVLNPPKLVGLVAPFNTENRSQQCHCLFPSPTVGCIHLILSLECLFFTLSNPWTNILYSHTTNTVQTRTLNFYKIHAHTKELHVPSLCIFSLHGKMLSVVWKSIFCGLKFSDPKTSQLFQPVSGHRFLVGKVYRIFLSVLYVALLLFVFHFFSSPFLHNTKSWKERSIYLLFNL